MGLESEPIAMFEQTAQRFARVLVARAAQNGGPNADERRDVLDSARELGLLAMCAPERATGLDQDVDALCAVLRPIARQDAGIASLLLVQAGAQHTLARAGTWPEEMLATDLVTWPAFDAAVATPNLRVAADGKIAGALPLVPCADLAPYLVAVAHDADGRARLVVCSMIHHGIECEPAPVLGLSCLTPFDVRLAGVPACAITEHDPSGDERIAWLALGVAAIALGLLEGSLATALDYARQRRQGGRLIIEWREVRRMLAQLHRSASIVASALTGVLAKRSSGGAGWHDDAILLALEATERASVGTTDGVQLLGGNGYMKDYPQERRMRDARQLRALLGPAHLRSRRACDAWLASA